MPAYLGERTPESALRCADVRTKGRRSKVVSARWKNKNWIEAVLESADGGEQLLYCWNVAPRTGEANAHYYKRPGRFGKKLSDSQAREVLGDASKSASLRPVTAK